jgi:hypothetical protein
VNIKPSIAHRKFHLLREFDFPTSNQKKKAHALHEVYLRAGGGGGGGFFARFTGGGARLFAEFSVPATL